MPEFRLYLADQLVPLWQATEARWADAQPPPFWAFAWPGSQALARYLMDTAPALVRGQRVLDFGSGSGLAAIAAAHLGAAHVQACDLDPLAATVQQLNAELNGVAFQSHTADLVGTSATELQIDVLLAGDVCYEREPAERTTRWLKLLSCQGVMVLLADPGRQYAPRDGLELLASYDVPTLHELESAPSRRTQLWRVHCAA